MNSLLPYKDLCLDDTEENSTLPKDWKAARGRGRIIQLRSMSPEQREEEKRIRLEKNKKAAKEIREKRKRKFKELEEKIETLKKIISTKKDDKIIKILNEKDERISILQEVIENQSKKIMILLGEN